MNPVHLFFGIVFPYFYVWHSLESYSKKHLHPSGKVPFSLVLLKQEDCLKHDKNSYIWYKQTFVAQDKFFCLNTGTLCSLRCSESQLLMAIWPKIQSNFLNHCPSWGDDAAVSIPAETWIHGRQTAPPALDTSPSAATREGQQCPQGQHDPCTGKSMCCPFL